MLKKREKSRKTEKKDIFYHPQAFEPWTKAMVMLAL